MNEAADPITAQGFALLFIFIGLAGILGIGWKWIDDWRERRRIRRIFRKERT